MKINFQEENHFNNFGECIVDYIFCKKRDTRLRNILKVI